MIRRLVGPAAKISEKRRLQCYNNLVMLNNASLFYRMEYGRSPRSLAELIEGRFVDPAKIVCPHGGAYAFDPGHDACTCSLHNRLKYLTPNIELTVLNVSQHEAAEYDRYKQRYQAFWQGMFDPDRRADHGRPPREAGDLRAADGQRQPVPTSCGPCVDKTPRPLGTARIAPSALASLVMVPGRKAIAEQLRGVPGVAEVLRANPTLTDLGWLGDRVSLHFCDGALDPARSIRPRCTRCNCPCWAMCRSEQQGAGHGGADGLEDAGLRSRSTSRTATRRRSCCEQLSQQVILQGTDLSGLRLSADAYRLPDYKGHPLYVFSVELYAIKLRLHVAVVGDQLVVATKPELLREVIDASTAQEGQPPAPAHMLVRLNRRGLNRAYDDAQLYWEEKARTACNRNISSIYQSREALRGARSTRCRDFPRRSTACSISVPTTATTVSTPSGTRWFAPSTAIASNRGRNRIPTARRRSPASSRTSTRSRCRCGSRTTHC